MPCLPVGGHNTCNSLGMYIYTLVISVRLLYYHFARPEKSKKPGLLVLQGPTVTCRRTCSPFTHFSPLMLPGYLFVVPVQWQLLFVVERKTLVCPHTLCSSLEQLLDIVGHLEPINKQLLKPHYLYNLLHVLVWSFFPLCCFDELSHQYFIPNHIITASLMHLLHVWPRIAYEFVYRCDIWLHMHCRLN